MPELPEIRAHAERLDAAFGGATLVEARPLHLNALKTVAPADDGPLVLDGVRQRGKYLVFDLGRRHHLVHLMQGGRLRPDGRRARRPRGGVFRWRFADGRALLLTEAGTERRAGVWIVDGDPLVAGPLADLGPDADTVDRDELADRLGRRSARLHGWLRDQANLAGIGRLLANEICYAARLSPFARTGALDADAVGRLHRAIGEVIADHLAHERSLDDIGPSAARPRLVHGRAGERCPDCDCDDRIRSVTYRRYTVAYCPARQTGGRILADNTTSRFLR